MIQESWQAAVGLKGVAGAEQRLGGSGVPVARQQGLGGHPPLQPADV